MATARGSLSPAADSPEEKTLDRLKERYGQLNCDNVSHADKMLKLHKIIYDELFKQRTNLKYNPEHNPVNQIKKFLFSIDFCSPGEFNDIFAAVFEEEFEKYANEKQKVLRLIDFENLCADFDLNAKYSLYSPALKKRQKILCDEFNQYYLETNTAPADEKLIENFKTRFNLLDLTLDKHLSSVMPEKLRSFIQRTVEYPYFAKKTALSYRKIWLFSSRESKNAPATNTMRQKLNKFLQQNGNLNHRDLNPIIAVIVKYRITLLNNNSKRTLPILDAYLFPLFMPHVEHRNLTLTKRKGYHDSLIDYMVHYFNPTIPITHPLPTTAATPVATNDNPQLIKLNTCINEILIACLAFAAKESDYNLFLLAPDSERLCGQNRFSLFAATHLPLAETACNALIAIRDDKTTPIETKINSIVTTTANYREQLSIKQSERYLSKIDEYFIDEMWEKIVGEAPEAVANMHSKDKTIAQAAEEKIDALYQTNFTTYLKAYIDEKVGLSQHNHVAPAALVPSAK